MKLVATAIAAAAILTGVMVTFADAQRGVRCTTTRVGNTTYTNCY